jgi:CIC family chloride channel protein
MHSASQSPFHLGRLLEARRSDAPVLGWSVAVGVLVGLVGGSFRSAIRHAEQLMDGLRELPGGDGAGPIALSVLATAGLAGAALWLVQRFAPEAGGSGIQEIEGALDGVRPLRWARVLIVKFGAGLLSLGTGMVMGREGPTVQMGGALGQMLRERFRLSDDDGLVLVAAGAGAGLTAAFNAPLAGMLFVFEEMRPHFKYNVISVQCVLIACAVADAVVRGLLGNSVAFAVGDFPMPELSALGAFAVFGLLVGAVGWLFNSAVLWTLDRSTGLRLEGRLAWAATVGACVGALVLLAPDLVGGGYRAIQDAASGRYAESGLLLLFVGRLVMTVVCFSTGVPGGIFAPLVALGTILGLWFSGIVPDSLPGATVDEGVFMIAGAGALFAATVRAPLTGVVLAAELTGNFGLILPIAVSCITATLVAHALGGRPIYTSLLEREIERDPSNAANPARSAGSA